MTSIGICLATFNGARFLDAQLQSIAAQTHSDWHLYARDDGSVDATPAGLAAFASAQPGRVTILTDTAGRLGVTGNFNRLMAAVPQTYVGFADQDDVWRPNKLERALAALQALEAAAGAGAACMVHADRALIDAAGRPRAASYWQSRRLNPAAIRGPERHYAFCLAAGATMLINRPLLDLAGPVPEAARAYDCWIELLAHQFGMVAALDDIALDHRRHGQNASGSARDIDSPAARRPWARALRLLGNLEIQRNVYRRYAAQAAALERRHGAQLDPKAAARLAGFLSLPDRGIAGRALALWASGAAPPGLARALTLVALSGRQSAFQRTAGQVLASRPNTSR